MSNKIPDGFAPKPPSQPQIPTAQESQQIINETQVPPNEHETTLGASLFSRDNSLMEPARENKGITNDSLMEILTNPVEDGIPVITDGVEQNFGPDISVKAVPKKNIKMDASAIDDSFLGKGIITAKPLSMPEMLAVKPKDPHIMFRWVNYKSEEGSRVTRYQSMGFDIAAKEDIDGPLPMELKQGAIGIVCYDVVLMKIDKMRLLGAYEYNLQKSQRMVSRKGSHDKALETAVAQLKADMTANNVPAEYLKGRVGYFMPNSEIAEAITR
jgi:hypothetical protein